VLLVLQVLWHFSKEEKEGAPMSLIFLLIDVNVEHSASNSNGTLHDQ